MIAIFVANKDIFGNCKLGTFVEIVSMRCLLFARVKL